MVTKDKYPEDVIQSKPYTSLCTSAHPSAPLRAPLCTSAHLHAPLRTPPCTSAHLRTPPRTYAHLRTPLCHLHVPLCAPPCTPPCTSAHLCAPLCTPPHTSTHNSDWLIVPTTTNHIPAFKNLINIKSWFFSHHLFEKPPSSHNRSISWL